MTKNTIQEDRKLAEKICRELRSGNREAILIIYHRFHPYFRSFVQKRIGSTGLTEDLLTDFWLELLSGKAVCAYEGLNNAALRSYLTKILILRIIDLQRKEKRQEKHIVSPLIQEDISEDEYLSQIASDAGERQPSPEDITIQKQQAALFRNALLLLHEMSPADAKYIRLRMAGMTYEEIAETETDKKTDAVKKQYTRKKTGSLAKFSIILENLMTEGGIKKEDLL